jgi:RNA-dependent RNA polymerase
MFTDGIGKISSDLMERISLKLSIRDLSILQIRYKGAKGLLVLDPRLPKNTIHLRKSMMKYDCTHESAKKYLDILDWNKYKSGTLNRQTIILLKSLGIEDRVFIKRQQDHIDRISNLSFKDCSIFKHLNEDIHSDISSDINYLEPANVTILQLLRAGFRLEEEPFFRGVLETMKKNGYHQLKMKSNIMIEKSARIIGVPIFLLRLSTNMIF